MRNDESGKPCYFVVDTIQDVERQHRRQRMPEVIDEIVGPWSYCAKRARGTIRLSLVEYRILKFLADRPNRAISQERIASAVSSRGYRVTPETLSRHIQSLRAQLGFFNDYIQSVPFLGYRFKA